MTKELEIPWKKFSEEEIQALLAMLFHSLDYSIEELHKSDRANECGADIIARKSKESLAIAVKIKPDNKDRPQLIDLSRRKETTKIYVYIETPTKKFSEFSKSYKKVKFWDVKKLNECFFEKNPYFATNIIFDNHSINNKLDSIQFVFYNLWKLSHKRKKKKFNEMNKLSFFFLWRLKDISVVLNQTNSLIKILLEKPIQNKNKEINVLFINIFIDYLSLLEQKISEFLTFFLTFYSNNKNLVNNSIIEQGNRSHWLWLGEHQPLNDLSSIKKELAQSIESKKLDEEFFKNFKNVPKDKEWRKYEEEISKGNDVWAAIDKKLRALTLFGTAVEEIIDDITKEYFSDYSALSNIQYYMFEKKAKIK